MKLYLVRHATATERLGGSVKRDYDRPLVDEGQHEAHLMATSLRRLGVRGDAFLASPYVRTRQTAEIFAEILAHTYSVDLTESLAPGGEHKEVIAKLSSLKHAQHIFLFGHMPDIAQLACTLLCVPEMDLQFKKCAVCCLELADMPPTRPALLKWFVTPKVVEACKK
jgi:phosphohistidine phosphatase